MKLAFKNKILSVIFCAGCVVFFAIPGAAYGQNRNGSGKTMSLYEAIVDYNDDIKSGKRHPTGEISDPEVIKIIESYLPIGSTLEEVKKILLENGMKISRIEKNASGRNIKTGGTDKYDDMIIMNMDFKASFWITRTFIMTARFNKGILVNVYARIGLTGP